MKRAIIVLTFLSISLGKIYGQQSTMGTIPGKVIDTKSSTRAIMTQLPMAPPETTGDVYLHSYWTIADITLTGKETELTGCSIKYNLQTNDLEIQYEQQVKVLPGRRIGHFLLIKPDGTKEKYVNGRNYHLDTSPVAGFLRVLDSGRWTLMVKPEIKVVEATYNPALHVGERDNQFVKDETFYISKGNALYKIDLPVKKFCKQFPGYESQVNSFIKAERINLKKDNDLTTLLNFLNEHI